MEISVFGTTDIGCRRERNEDSYLINTDYKLCVVADGMGGHLGGEFASRLAISTIEEVVSELMQDPDTTLQSNIEVRPGDYKSYLKYAIGVAGNRIYERASRDPSLHGMGTTIVALLFADDRAFYAHVGDSRCYLIRSGKIKQLTQDHSLVSEQLKAGIIQPSDVRNHKFKNIITRSVGFQEDVDIDIDAKQVRTGDKFLLCTDGLTNMVSNEDILAIAAEKSPRDACNELVERANENGGEDNITVIVCEVEAVEKIPLADEETEGI